MQLAVSWSTERDTTAAVDSSYQHLVTQLGAPPDLLVLHCTATLDLDEVMRRIRHHAPAVPLHGGTSCEGVMTGDGFHSGDGVALGMLGIRDPGGAFGVGVCEIGSAPRAAGRDAVLRALEHAGRPGEVPAMVWMTAAPGHEEQVILGIEDLVGKRVPIAGGSSADNEIAGRWRQLAGVRVHEDAVVTTVFFPTTDLMFAFHSGYEPTATSGRITRAEGRLLHEIDGRPAAKVYNAWTGGSIQSELEGGGNILARTTLSPIGRVVGRVGGIPYFQLSHPDNVTADGALSLFTEVVTGEEICLMEGTTESLVTRAGRVAETALRTHGANGDDVAGALVVFCAGCMLAVREQMDAVAAGVSAALHGKPFLGAFTFGEQGCFPGGENRHGNLMISVLVFTRERSR